MTTVGDTDATWPPALATVAAHCAAGRAHQGDD